jgi:hypothetical protein
MGGREELACFSLNENFEHYHSNFLYVSFSGYFQYPLEGLDGLTPAEACGIVVNGQNKWMTLIQNSARAK